MSDEYSAKVDGVKMPILLRKNTLAKKGKTISLRKIFIGSSWFKGKIVEITEDNYLVIDTNL